MFRRGWKEEEKGRGAGFEETNGTVVVVVVVGGGGGGLSLSSPQACLLHYSCTASSIQEKLINVTYFTGYTFQVM